MAPIIMVSFTDEGVVWRSSGWGENEKLMKKAKSAINRGKDPGEVCDLLRKAGFIVVEEM